MIGGPACAWLGLVTAIGAYALAVVDEGRRR
jgi:hypothetical protein